MINFVEKMKALVKDEEGAAAVEYGVLVAGIILVSILLIYSIGTKTGASFNAVDDAIVSPPTSIPGGTAG